VSNEGALVRHRRRRWERVVAIVRATIVVGFVLGLGPALIGARSAVSMTPVAQDRPAPRARQDRRVENVVQAVRRSYERRPPEWRRRAAVCLHYLDEAQAFHRQGEAYFVAASRARSSPEQSRLVRLGNDAIRERQRLIDEFWSCTRRTTTGDEFASQDRPPQKITPIDPEVPPNPDPPEVLPPTIPPPGREQPPERPGSWLPPGFPFPPAEARPPSRSPRTPPRSTVPVIVALGDSLTADGSRLTTAEAWPGVVEERLKAQGQNYRVKNAGVDNDTSAMALARLDRELDPNTKVLIVAIGMNDFKDRLPIDALKANIGAIIRRAQARGVKVLLCAFEEVRHGPPYDDQFKAVYPELQARYRVPMVRNLMNVVWNDPRTYTTDGIHPNARGAKQMAYKILPVLRPMLGIGSPARP
jgi:acyl-CoA thioesterase-1